MKKTVQVNIGGIAFHVDEDAFLRLRNYLSGIEKYYANVEEGKEILADIEARMAEILQDKVNRSKQAVSLEDISTVILILGEPEQFEDNEKEQPYAHKEKRAHTNHHSFSHPKQSKMERRRIFRNPDDSHLGGVCGGLAAYIGMKPLYVRALFVLAGIFYGSSILIYILLWAMLPEARTTSEKLEMHGEPINVNNIERTIRNEFDNFKRNVGI